MGRRHLLLLVPVAALLLGLASWAAWSFLDEPFPCALSGSETVAWAGFTVDDSVEVSDVSSECWLDQVLETSGFKGEFAPGLEYRVQVSLFDESAVAEMQSVESAAEIGRTVG